MAPGHSDRPGREKRVKALISFALDIQHQLPAAVSSRSPGALLHDIEKAISSFPGHLGTAAASNCEEIDSAGTGLWNLCTRLRREKDPETPQEYPVILDITRVYAFLLLACAHEHGKATPANLLRLMKIGVKATKNCFVQKEVGFAAKLLEKLAKYESLLKASQPELIAEHEEDRQRLCSEYFVLRTALAWHQKQFDIVEHMYTNARNSKRVFDPNTAESLADVLYELGKSLLASKQYDIATKWLERALEVLADQELDKLSMDASELRISIIQSCVKAQLKIKQEPALEKAQNLVQVLAHELGDKLIVLLLRLEVLAANTTAFDHVSYSEILGRIIRSAVLNEQNFKLVMFHIRKLNAKSPDLACKLIEDLFRLRIAHDGREELVEKITITRLWIAVAQQQTLEALSGLEGFLDSIIENFKNPITPGATLAAHTLLWKSIESNHTLAKYELAEKWCRLALHRVFEKAGELNMARISRKLLLCAFERQDTNNAMDIFASMSETAKNEPMTRFLMYKIAIQCNLPEVAAESLKAINSSSSADPTLLYACCLYSMEGQNKVQTLAALQLVLEKCSYGPPTPVHLPSLVRVTIGITSTLLHETSHQKAPNHVEVEELIEKLCKLFEGAVTAMRKSNKSAGSEPLWTVHELDWFSKNSYNTAIKNISVWTPFNSLRMLRCCIAFIEQYPPDIGETLEDLSLRKMFCEFSAAAALVSLARGEDNIEIQLQNYLDLRKHVKSFDALYNEKPETIEDVQTEDLLQKLAVLLAFDFEAACHLKAWDDLSETILNANICKSSRAYHLMADCLLCLRDDSRIQIPTQVLVFNLKKILNEAWGLETMDVMALAKYMRCLFQIAQSDNVEVAEELLNQIAAQAAEAHQTEQPYPTEELDWIASRAFNHAVDFYCNEQDEECKNWASKALNIAHFCNDEGALERLLQDKLAGLKLD